MRLSLEQNIFNRINYLNSKDRDKELTALWGPKHLHAEELTLLRTARLADLDFQKALLYWNPDIELRPKLKLNSQVGIVVINDEGQVLLTRNEPRIIHLNDEKGDVLPIRVNSKYSLLKEDIVTGDFTDIYNLVCVNVAARILKIEHIKDTILSQLTFLTSGPIFALRVKQLKIDSKKLEWVPLKGIFSQKGHLDQETEKTLCFLLKKQQTSDLIENSPPETVRSKVQISDARISMDY